MKITLQIAVLDLIQNWTMTVSKALAVAVTRKINWKKKTKFTPVDEGGSGL